MVHSARRDCGDDEMIAILLAILSIILAGGLAIVLPILAWAKMARLERELRELRAQLRALEGRNSQAPPAAAPEPRFAAPAPTEVAAPPTEPPIVPAPDMIAREAVSEDALPEVARRDDIVEPPAPEVPAPPPLPPEHGHPPYAATAETTSTTPEGLEEAIGGRLMLWVGTIVLVLGVAFFLKHAFDNNWITESMRVGLGIVVGLGLALAGDRFARRGYRAYGQVIAGGGVSALFLSIYAAFSYYGLIGQTPAFVLLVAVTAGAAYLADRQKALGLAVMAVGGGFATPFLVGSGQDAQVTLFSYDAILVCGTLFLARRHDWPVLNALSFLLTWFTIAAWASEFYSDAKWRRTEAFLTLFCVQFLAILRAHLRHRGRDVVALVLGLGPLLYHTCSILILQDHGVALWVYFIGVTVVAVAIAVRIGSIALRLTAWVLVVLPFVAWLDTHQSSQWIVPNLVSAIAIFALHALAQLDIVFLFDQRLGRFDNQLQHLNGYALIAMVYVAIEHVALAWAPLAVLAIGALHAGMAWLLRGKDRGAALHALAVAIGAVTIALALRLDGPWLTVALGIEGLAVVVVGLQLGQSWFRLAGFAFILAAVVRYIDLSLSATPTVFNLFQDQPFGVGAFLAGVLYFAAWRYRAFARAGHREGQQGMLLAVLLGSVMLVVALSAENRVYWDLRGETSADAGFASSLALSFIWTVCASAFIAVGMWRDFAPIRYLAIVLFGMTVLKVFLVDLSALGGIYRILGFIGVGIVLLGVSFVYQRARRKKPPQTEPA
jgi:uncharacterized membrane protein